MKLYELMQVMLPQDKDLDRIKIYFHEEEEVNLVQNTTRALLYFANTEVISLDMEGHELYISIGKKKPDFYDMDEIFENGHILLKD